jgi:hypothetical protein
MAEKDFHISEKYNFRHALNGPGITKDQLLEIATKYGLQDSIAEGYQSSTFKFFPPEAYPNLHLDFTENFFLNWRKFIDRELEKENAWKRLATVKTVTEYCDVVESTPYLWQMHSMSRKSIREYHSTKRLLLSGRNKIIIDDVGKSITVLPVEQDHSSFRGRLLFRNKQ